MGLGYSYTEATYDTYPNIPEVLLATGVINSRLYSVYLNDLSDISGTVLFGGIDPSKYTGNLATLDMLPDLFSGTLSRFITAVTDLAITTDGEVTQLFSGGSSGLDAYDDALPVLLDTGAAAWSVPSAYYDAYIAPSFPFVDEYGFCGCSHREDDTHLTLVFGGRVEIQVPIVDFLVPIYNTSTRAPIPFDDDEDTCALMIVPAGPTGYGFQTLGDAILRSMYVVFDLDNGQLSIAQAAEDNDAGTGRSNPIAVPRGPDGIASALSSASAAADYVRADSTQTWSTAPIVTAASLTDDLAASTADSTIGMATGTKAVPAGARVSDDGVPGGSISLGELLGEEEDDDDDDEGGSSGDEDSESDGNGEGGDGGNGGASETSGSVSSSSSSSSSSGDSSSTSSGAAAVVKGGGMLGPDWRGWWVSGVVVLGVGVGMGVMV